MEKLRYNTLDRLEYNGFLLKTAPEKLLQFGEGNFLRAFVDYWFDIANEKAGWNGKCVIVKPRNSPSNLWQKLNEQEGLYTLYLRGMENGIKTNRSRIISSVSRCLNPYTEAGFAAMMEVAVSDDLEYVVSNTTEAGIVYDPACRLSDTPCDSFPGKLTQVLYARFRAEKPGLIILPCELNDKNGDLLRSCVHKYIEQWNLEPGFRTFIDKDCLFCNTLVDRIVPGSIKDSTELARCEEFCGYHDDLIDVGEVFGVWNIEGPQWLEEKLPFRAAGVNCSVVPDVTPYKKRKVRILNGAHTGFVPGAYLAGFDIVRDCMEDDTVRSFMNKMLHEEIIPLLPLEREDLASFAAAVQDRFQNPFIDHALLSISLNSTSKWRERNLPSLLEYAAGGGALPECLAMSFAAYIAFYSNDILDLNENGLICRRPNGDTYICSDDRQILEFYYDRRSESPEVLVHAVMTNRKMWNMDLTAIPGFEAATLANLQKIRSDGALAAFASCL